MIILDFADAGSSPYNDRSWALFTDRVMGGVSQGFLTREVVCGRSALRMRGFVSLENDGGFVQMARDLLPGGGAFDASAFKAVEIDVIGNGESYGCHLRSLDTVRPWQSYRQSFAAGAAWKRIRLPFDGFTPHRIDAPLNLRLLRRIGLVAIGRPFEADLSVSRMAFCGA
jgi:hypothetical protein